MLWVSVVHHFSSSAPPLNTQRCKYRYLETNMPSHTHVELNAYPLTDCSFLIKGCVCSHARTALPPCLIPVSVIHYWCCSPLVGKPETDCHDTGCHIRHSPTSIPAHYVRTPSTTQMTTHIHIRAHAHGHIHIRAHVHGHTRTHTLIWSVIQYLQYNVNVGSNMRNAGSPRVTQQDSVVWSYGSNASGLQIASVFTD